MTHEAGTTVTLQVRGRPRIAGPARQSPGPGGGPDPAGGAMRIVPSTEATITGAYPVAAGPRPGRSNSPCSGADPAGRQDPPRRAVGAAARRAPASDHGRTGER